MPYTPLAKAAMTNMSYQKQLAHTKRKLKLTKQWLHDAYVYIDELSDAYEEVSTELVRARFALDSLKLID